MLRLYTNLVQSDSINCQTYASHKRKSYGYRLNYSSINNNKDTHGDDTSLYNYNVTNAVDLSRLFLLPQMAKYTAFNESCDASALLGLIVNNNAFPRNIQGNAKDVRSHIRNPWAHCNFPDWDNLKFNSSFQLMETLVRSLSLSVPDLTNVISDLHAWKLTGYTFLGGTRIGMEVLSTVTSQTKLLAETVVHLALDTNDETDKLKSAVQEVKNSLEGSMKTFSQIDTKLQAHSQSILELEKDTTILYSRTSDLKEKHGSLQDRINAHDNDMKEVKEMSKHLLDEQTEIKLRLESLESTLYCENQRPDELFFLAPDRLETFVGRSAELDFLKKKFIEAEHSGQTLAICGLGGIGKTTLAIEYAWLLQEHYPGGVFWLSAADDESLGNSIDQIAFEADIQGQDINDTTRRVLKWLTSVQERWLLVVDNLDEYTISKNTRNILTGAWKRRTTGHILVTTRRETVELAEEIRIRETDCIDLKVLNFNESVTFMEIRTGLIEDETLHELVEELGSLPLAMEQAAAYINVCKFSFAEYLKEFKDRRLELVSQKKISPQPVVDMADDRLTIKTTWSMNFELIQRQSIEIGQGGIAPLVMQVFAFCSPDDIPYELVNNGEPEIKQIDSENVKVPVRAKEIISILTKFSLFHRHGVGTVRVHRLVQEVIRDQIPPDCTKSVLCNAVRMMHYALTKTLSPGDVLKKDFDQSNNIGGLTLWNRLALNASVVQKFIFQFIKENTVEDYFLNTETIGLFHVVSIFHSIHRRQEDAFLVQHQMLEMIMSSKMTSENMLQFTTLKVPLLESDRRRILNSITSVSLLNESELNAPTDVDNLRERGNLAFKSGHFHTAIQLYSDAIRFSDGIIDDRLYANRSQCHRKVGDHKRSMEDADLCILTNPANWKGHARRCYAIPQLINEATLPKAFYSSGLASASIASYYCPSFYIEFQTKIYYPILVYKVVQHPSELVSDIQNVTERPLTTLLLPDGEYRIGQIFIVKSVQLVGLGDKVHIHIDQTTGTGLIRLPGSVLSATLHFETDEQLSIHFENITLSEGGGQLVIGPGITTTLYRCTISNGKKGCRDFPKCAGGEGCVNEGPIPCSVQSMAANRMGPTESRSLGEQNSGVCGYPGIYCGDGGKVYIDRCVLKRCGGGGVLCEGYGSYMEIKNCEVKNMIQVGLEVRNGGFLKAENNLIFQNQSHGVIITPKGNGLLRGNVIHGNGREGIICQFHSTAKIENNSIHHNGLCGVSMDGGSYELKSNQIFENWCWGVMLKSRTSCSLLNNEIFENKCGGIRIGTNYSAAVFIDGNTIRDHCGPALHIEPCFSIKGFQILKDAFATYGLPEDEEDIYTVPPIYTDRNIERGNNQTYLHPTKFAESISACFYCHIHSKKLLHCAKCKKASYCCKTCQTEDWNRHKRMCRILLGSYTVGIEMNKTEKSGGLTVLHRTLKGVKEGPKPDRKSSKEFIVKIQSGFEYYTYNPNQQLLLNDKSTDVDFSFVNPGIYHLIMECGQLGKNTLSSKKIYCRASFENQGTILRIRTDTLAPYQTW